MAAFRLSQKIVRVKENLDLIVAVHVVAAFIAKIIVHTDCYARYCCHIYEIC